MEPHKLRPTIEEALVIRRRFQIIALLASIVLVIGVLFYRYVEDLSWIDALYFTVITLTTVGYGDISPQTSVGKLFTIGYLLIGISIIAALVNNFVRAAVARKVVKDHERENGKP